MWVCITKINYNYSCYFGLWVLNLFSILVGRNNIFCTNIMLNVIFTICVKIRSPILYIFVNIIILLWCIFFPIQKHLFYQTSDSDFKYSDISESILVLVGPLGAIWLIFRIIKKDRGKTYEKQDNFPLQWFHYFFVFSFYLQLNWGSIGGVITHLSKKHRLLTIITEEYSGVVHSQLFSKCKKYIKNFNQYRGWSHFTRIAYNDKII